MLEVGRLCIKTSGRDAGKKAVVIEVIDKCYVLIDGETRRRKCSILHLEPTQAKLEIKKGASHSDIISTFKKLNIEIKTSKPKKAKERLKKNRKSLSKKTVEERPKKTVKKIKK